MSTQPLDGWQWLGNALPVLPAPWLMRVWLNLGWAVVLAWVGVWLVRSRVPSRAVQAGVALTLAGWTLLPGAYAPAYWLGLAFQMPAIATVLVCALLLTRNFVGRSEMPTAAGTPAGALISLWVLGAVTGWALLLDTVAWFPVQFYAWGFGPVAASLALPCTMLPWALDRHAGWRDGALWVAPVAVALFVLTRLPTGNVWDAVLDPWLWLVLHPALVRWMQMLLKK